jgi:predicted phosphoribosyltransferase
VLPLNVTATYLTTPEIFYGVGQWYREFDSTTDEEVIGLLELAHQEYETLKKQENMASSKI